MKTLKAALLAAALCAGPAWAEWVEFSEADDSTLYIDPDTVRKNGHSRRVWAMQDLKHSNEGIRSRRMQQEYHCQDESVRILYLSTHSDQMAKGTTLDSHGGKDPWTPIPPGTVASRILKFVCR